MRVSIHLGDITTDTDVDAIVNAANPTLLGGCGVDGAIHNAAGPSVLEECRKLGGCAYGDAKITRAGRLPAKCVIHAVGPVWHGGDDGEEAVLWGCYRRCLDLAQEYLCEKIAFPLISTGAYGFPLEVGARIALDAMYGSGEVHMWAWHTEAYAVLSRGLPRVA